jgi:hypothetical protein
MGHEASGPEAVADGGRSDVIGSKAIHYDSFCADSVDGP